MRTMVGVLSILVVASFVGANGALADPCSCDDAKRHNGWCVAHEVGYVAGVKITSEAVFEALDAHGHQVDRARLGCDRCRENYDRGNGYCEEHKIGFVDGVAYLSALNYFLARGELTDPAGIECPICKRNAASHGWCDRCNVGRVGDVVIVDRAEFEEIERALRILHAANETVARCETCAVAMILNGTCTRCKITYRDGERISGPSR